MRNRYVALRVAGGLLLAAVTTAVADGTNTAAITAHTPAMTDPVSAEEAAGRVGDSLTVTARVASTFYMDSSERKPTFLNLERAYPNQALTVVIFGEHRDRFPAPPERLFLHRLIAVTGEVVSSQNRPEIVVSEPSAIHLLAEAPGTAPAGSSDAAAPDRLPPAPDE